MHTDPSCKSWLAGEVEVFAIKEVRGVLKVTCMTMHLSTGKCTVHGQVGQMNPSEATVLSP